MDTSLVEAGFKSCKDCDENSPTNERPTDASAIHEIGHQKIVPKSLKFATLSIKRIYNIITSHHHEQSKPNYQELNPHIQQFRASIDN